MQCDTACNVIWTEWIPARTIIHNCRLYVDRVKFIRMIPIKYRRFAIRPRLAYFRRVRSPRCRRRGMFAPTDSFPESAPAQCSATLAHVAATWSPKKTIRRCQRVAFTSGKKKKKNSLRGDEYRPRARARACVYHARSLPESFSRKTLCLSQLESL